MPPLFPTSLPALAHRPVEPAGSGPLLPVTPNPIASPGSAADTPASAAAAAAAPGGWLVRHAGRAFALLAALHLLAWTLGPAWVYESLPRDTLEGLTWGYMGLWSYDKHPPLAAWLSALMTDAFGTVGWPVFLGAQLCIVTALAGVWSLTRRLAGAQRALLAVLLMEGVYYYSLASITLNPNIVMLPACAWLAWASWRLVERPSMGRWLAVGALSAASLLAKYQSVIVILALLAALAASPRGRRALAQGPGLLAAVALCTLLMLPHATWVLHHDLLPVRYALGLPVGNGGPIDPLSAGSPTLLPPALDFIWEQALAALPAVLLLMCAGWPQRRVPATDAWSADIGRDAELAQAARRFVWILACGPLFIMASLIAARHSIAVARWGFPTLCGLGTALAVLPRPAVTPQGLRRTALAAAALTAVLLIGQTVVVRVAPEHTGRPPYSITEPTRQLARQVTSDWRAEQGRPLRIVGGDRWVVSGLCAYSPDRPRPLFDLRFDANPWVSTLDIDSEGMALVFRPTAHYRDADIDRDIASWRARYPAMGPERVYTLPQVGHPQLPPVRWRVVFIPPLHASAFEPSLP